MKNSNVIFSIVFLSIPLLLSSSSMVSERFGDVLISILPTEVVDEVKKKDEKTLKKKHKKHRLIGNKANKHKCTKKRVLYKKKKTIKKKDKSKSQPKHLMSRIRKEKAQKEEASIVQRQIVRRGILFKKEGMLNTINTSQPISVSERVQEDITRVYFLNNAQNKKRIKEDLINVLYFGK